MRVECEVTDIDMLNEDGNPQEGVSVRCGECGHETESFGTSRRSVKRCLALLREECPEEASNFYVVDEDDLEVRDY